MLWQGRQFDAVKAIYECWESYKAEIVERHNDELTSKERDRLRQLEQQTAAQTKEDKDTI